MNAEVCLPTSRTIPSHQPYAPTPLRRDNDFENPKLMSLAFLPHEFVLPTIWNFILSLILSLVSSLKIRCQQRLDETSLKGHWWAE